MNTQAGDSRARFYRTYASTHGLKRPERDSQWFPVLDHLPKDPACRLLDVGCGDGSFLRQAQQGGMTSAFGIDVSEEQVQRAQESGMTNVVRADALEFLGGSPDSWDCITTTDVLEHFTHDEVVALTGAIASALREGGTWVAQVPNATSPFFGNYAYGDFTHRTVFTVRSMQQIARLVGLVPVGAFPVGPPTGGGLKRTARRITYTVGAAAMKAFLASETGQWSGLVVSQNLVFVAAKSVDTPAVEVGNGHA